MAQVLIQTQQLTTVLLQLTRNDKTSLPTKFPSRTSFRTSCTVQSNWAFEINILDIVFSLNQNFVSRYTHLVLTKVTSFSSHVMGAVSLNNLYASISKRGIH